MKDVLLQVIKTEICNFVPNKINEKLNAHNKNQFKTIVGKTIVHNLEREIEFLRKEILKTKQFKIWLDIIPKKIIALTKMHGTLTLS